MCVLARAERTAASDVDVMKAILNRCARSRTGGPFVRNPLRAPAERVSMAIRRQLSRSTALNATSPIEPRSGLFAIAWFSRSAQLWPCLPRSLGRPARTARAAFSTYDSEVLFLGLRKSGRGRRVRSAGAPSVLATARE